jgi:hypothetical protein
MQSTEDSTKISGDSPIFCPYCNKIQAKRGFITMILQKDKYFMAQCWFCTEEFVIDNNFDVKKLIS